MRRKTANRAIALLLTVVMAVGLCGTSVFAAGGDPLASGVTGGSYTDPSVEAGKTYEYTIVDDITGETATVLATVEDTRIQDATTTETYYSLVQSPDANALNGTYILVTGNYALNSSLGRTSVTVENQEIVGEQTALEWTFSGSDGSYTVKNNENKFLNFASSTILFWTSYSIETNSSSQNINVTGSSTVKLSYSFDRTTTKYLTLSSSSASAEGSGTDFYLYQKNSRSVPQFNIDLSAEQEELAGYNESDYTAESWAEFEAAYEAAQQAVDNAIAGAPYGSKEDASAALTAVDTAMAAMREAAKQLVALEIVTPEITWERTKELVYSETGTGQLVTGVEFTAAGTDGTYPTVFWDWSAVSGLTTDPTMTVWDYNTNAQYARTQNSDDGLGSIPTTTKTVIAATWCDRNASGALKGWGTVASVRKFSGTFTWPEGYDLDDTAKLVSVNDANYQAIYDYIENSDDAALKAAYEGKTVLPINDDMYVFIYKEGTTLTAENYLNYLAFWTGTSGKGVWCDNTSNKNADWGRTESPTYNGVYATRAFHGVYPNLDTDVDTTRPKITDVSTFMSQSDTWYSFADTSGISTVLQRSGTIAAGDQVHIDIYCFDNSGFGGMDELEFQLTKRPLTSQTVEVRYWLNEVGEVSNKSNYLGNSYMNGVLEGTEVTLVSGTDANQLNYKKAAAITAAGSKDVSNGVQLAAPLTVTKDGNNVINVVYTTATNAQLYLTSNTSTVQYNGTNQTINGLTVTVVGGENPGVATLNSNDTWTLPDGNTLSNVSANATGMYCGTYTNTITATGYTVTTSDGSVVTNSYTIVKKEGTLTITPVTDFVIDYGLPLEITPSDMGFAPNGSTTFTLGNAVLQYGDAALSNSDQTLTYTPNKTVDGVESIPVSGLAGAGGYTYSGSINIIPATNVLYEERFVDISANDGDGDHVDWVRTGTESAAKQTTEPAGLQTNVYGYDDAYATDQESSAYSNGSAWKATVNEACQGLNYASNCPKAEFTFTGTGFDIYSECGADTGMLFVTVRNAETNAAVAGYMVDTLFNGTFYTAGDNGTVTVDGGMVYQIPVVHNADLTYGTYKVTVYGYYVNRNVDATPMSVSGADDAVTAESLAKELGLDDVGLQFVYMDKSSPLATLAAGGAIRRDSDDGAVTFAAGAEQIVYLDGFRVYNPLGTATLSVAAQNAYTGDSEINPTYVSLFKVLMEQSEQNQNVFVFIEKSGETYTLNNEYQIKSGPQNEIYLKSGQSVAFTATSSRVMVSAKTINGATTLTNGNKSYEITSGTEQYFELTGMNDTYTITNSGDNILSLVNLKLIDGALATVEAEAYTSIATALGAPVTLQDGTVVEPEQTEPDPVEPEWVNPYDDVHQQDWFYEYVKYVTQHGLMNGMGDGKFAPKIVMNRAMLATVLYRIAGEPEVSGEMPFSDVATGEWYSDAILWAAQKGVVEGVGGGKFAPNDPLTREQMVTMLYRYWKLSNPDAAAADETGEQFKDWDLVSDWALEAMRWAVANGQINGMTAETLSPQGSLPREQAATLLARYDRLVSGK